MSINKAKYIYNLLIAERRHIYQDVLSAVREKAGTDAACARWDEDNKDSFGPEIGRPNQEFTNNRLKNNEIRLKEINDTIDWYVITFMDKEDDLPSSKTL